MGEQIKHKRISKKGKPFFAGKKVKDRYFIGRQVGKPQPEWKAKVKEDKDLTYFQLVEWKKYPPSPFGDADGDGILNIFDKKPLDAGERHQVPPGVKKGNIKLEANIGIFNLPRSYTCPGKTELCSKYCYAEGPEKFRSGVVHSRNKNVAWSMRDDFTSVMSRMIKSFNVPWFRIHESGDFYNQKYFDKWVEIAKNNPKTKFLAYTKNWMLDFSDAPSNLTIRYSSDVSSKHIREDLPNCYVGVNSPKYFFTCKKRCAPGFCMACWDKEFDIFIPIHSISKKDVDQMFFKQFNPEIPDALKKREIADAKKEGLRPISTSTALKKDFVRLLK